MKIDIRIDINADTYEVHHDGVSSPIPLEHPEIHREYDCRTRGRPDHQDLEHETY